MDDSIYIEHCKHLIESMLDYPENTVLKQRDYLRIIELLENKTGITLSLTTIKRIWKPNYKGNPHPSTLDAFALFLGYKNWFELKKESQHTVSERKYTLSINKKLISKHSIKKIGFLLLAIILLFGVFIIFSRFNYNIETSNKLEFNPDNIEFSCNNSVSKGVPNTVIFKYNASQINADSIFIQQSWKKFRRDRVQICETTLTSIYYYPGFHKAKLIANDSIVKETNVRVNTDGWLSLARDGFMDESPVYIRNSDLINNGALHVSKHHLNSNNIDVNSTTMVSYYYVDEFENLSSSDFCFETKVKCDSIFNLPCPNITIRILGENSVNIIPLIRKGCVGNTMIKVGNVLQIGKNNDLSSFGCNVYKWQEVVLQVKNNLCTVYINDENVYTINFTEDIGNIVGFNVNFTGTGSIDYIKLSDNDNTLIYETEFDSP